MRIQIRLILLILLLTHCKNDCVNTSRCDLDPDVGPCKAIVAKYYYDKTDKKCKAFNWGGCDGVVPFNTLAECEKGCGCD
jgi:hypothetical protein